MMIEQAAAAAGLQLVGNAPPAKQRGAKHWRAFLAALRPLIDDLQEQRLLAYQKATRAMQEATRLRQQLAELQPTPFELLVCRARQGSEALERTYRQLAMQLHPDQGGSAAAFRELQADYEAVQALLTALRSRKGSAEMNTATKTHRGKQA